MKSDFTKLAGLSPLPNGETNVQNKKRLPSKWEGVSSIFVEIANTSSALMAFPQAEYNQS